MGDARLQELQALLPNAMLTDWVRIGTRVSRLLRDRPSPAEHDGVLGRLLEEARTSVRLREQRLGDRPAIQYPSTLPITARRREIVEAIRKHQVVIISGETGSGKTTQIPKMCLEAGLGIEGKIACTQPRRVAAVSISRRISEELGVTWGREVGCKIRFDDRSSPHTYIKLMTDGILLAETQGDPALAEYNAILIDEAHERSLNIDFLLGYLKLLLARRTDLKLIVTSATIDTEAFSRHFEQAPVIEVSGRMYPVEIVYAPIAEEDEEAEPDAGAESLSAESSGSFATGREAAVQGSFTAPWSPGADLTYVEAAVLATEQVLLETSTGDVLMFMPSERDIREAADQLEGRFAGEAEVVPLFGRLSAADQMRVFAPSSRRKVVIATNIAETSLTIPGIRYVIDAGLVRLSRYNPRTRTKRLPIEPISQSSAQQRAGRAGRVEDGVCIRLYAESDFLTRPPFTQPEIQRANLAEVILRMKAFSLGDIETFPFVQPPAPAAISNGYALLQELGALDGERALTSLGHDLARLPIDPTLGRMLLQSQHEHATRELLIIAAGLSIQDPRERPLEQKEAALAAHRRFNDPQSDFLALLNIWNAVHDEWETLRTQSQRRRFCRQHFLSYVRMREWQDLHAQLHDSLEDLGTVRLNESSAAYEAVHRSILAGLIGHVGIREERNQYKTTGNRMVTLFPGSSLYERGEPVKKRAPRDPAPPQAKTRQPEWMMAGEVVETSQLFARTIAGIDPQWIAQVAPHVCKRTHRNPHWSTAAGKVVAEEVSTLLGLEVQRRTISYATIEPGEATTIFIRSALVEENILPPRPTARARTAHTARDVIAHELDADDAGDPGVRELPRAYRFLEHNRAVRHKIENWQTRVRHYDLGDLDQRLHAFYAQRMQNVSSLPELNNLLRDHPEPGFLCATDADLAGAESLHYDPASFPDAVTVGGQPVSVRYAYAPGEEHDGVTIQLPFTLAESASAALLEWAVPGLREGKVTELLRALPKAIRRELMPFPPKVAEIVREFQPGSGAFLLELGRFLSRRYGVAVSASDWPADALPAHLRPRLEIVGGNQKAVASGRDLNALRAQLQAVPAPAASTAESPAWQRAAGAWERFGVTAWTFGDLPGRITVSDGPGLPLYGWPGLEFAEGNVQVRLFRSAELARDRSGPGLRRLVELMLQKDLAWLAKDLGGLNRLAPLYAPLGPVDELAESALENLKRYLLPATAVLPLTQAQFDRAVTDARAKMPGLGQQLLDRIAAILQLRQSVQQRIGTAAPSPGPGARKQPLTDLKQLGAAPAGPSAVKENVLALELKTLVPPRFPDRVPFERLAQLPRYLKALLTRLERASYHPAKDQERTRLVAPYAAALHALEETRTASPEGRQAVEEFRWMLEEYRVSVFAQELGTAVPVSPKRLDDQLAQVRALLGLPAGRTR